MKFIKLEGKSFNTGQDFSINVCSNSCIEIQPFYPTPDEAKSIVYTGHAKLIVDMSEEKLIELLEDL